MQSRDNITNYKQKYLKYKIKYLEKKGGFKNICPNGTYLCKPGTNYMGTCVNHPSLCNKNYNESNSKLPILELEETCEDKDLKERFIFGSTEKGY